MRDIPAKIKQLRASNKWTQKQLASKLGVSPRTVENWEQGRRSVSGPALVILKKLMGD